jgi:hypothetical protein
MVLYYWVILHISEKYKMGQVVWYMALMGVKDPPSVIESSPGDRGVPVLLPHIIQMKYKTGVQ